MPRGACAIAHLSYESLHLATIAQVSVLTHLRNFEKSETSILIQNVFKKASKNESSVAKYNKLLEYTNIRYTITQIYSSDDITECKVNR